MSGVRTAPPALPATRIVVGATQAGQRLDAVVAGATGVSAAAARRLIAGGAVRVGGRPAVKGTRVTDGALVEIAARVVPTQVVLPDGDIPIAIVYEDEHLIAIDKPAGIPSHPLSPGERGCAANGIVARFPECAGASSDPREGGLGHRLDTATSGVLIAARSRTVWTALRRALGAVDCEKRYLCEVWGAPPNAGRIDVDIGRRGRRGGVVRTDGGRQPRPAETSWTVIARGTHTVLLEARLHAGRPHQVRAHLAAAGHPIVGDDRYGERAVVAAGGLRLHAASVRLAHPVTGAPLLIVAPAPSWAKPDAIG